MIRARPGHDLSGGEVLWAESTPETMRAAFEIGVDPAPVVQAKPPPKPVRPRKLPRRAPSRLDLVAAGLLVVCHTLGVFFVVPHEWAVRELLAVTYVTGAVALALALWTRWSDPGFLPQGLAAERLASQDAPGRHTVTPEVALYWKHRRAYGLTPVAAAPSKEPAEAAGWCGASGAGPQSEAVCPTCRLHKPLRASHCAASGRCVARLDHHCAWLGCAVGASNHARFVAFLWVAAAHFAVSCATCSVTVLGPLSGGTGGAGALSSVVLTGLCAVSAVFTAFAGALVADQALNIATDTTVRERKRGLAGGGPGAAPASAWAGRWRRSTWHAADNTIRFWAEGL